MIIALDAFKGGNYAAVTGVCSRRGKGVALGVKKTARRQRKEERDRVRRFLALPEGLQEGCLRYAECIIQAYSERGQQETGVIARQVKAGRGH
jgi:hypothetical protein